MTRERVFAGGPAAVCTLAACVDHDGAAVLERGLHVVRRRSGIRPARGFGGASRGSGAARKSKAQAKQKRDEDDTFLHINSLDVILRPVDAPAHTHKPDRT